MRASFLIVAGALFSSAPGVTAGGQGVPGAGGELRFTSVSAGATHSCGLTADGVAYCWGKNTYGQLGDSSNVDRVIPVPVSGGITFRMIAAGGGHTCGIATDDTPYCWGRNDRGQLGIGTEDDRTYPSRVDYLTRGMGRMRVSVINAGAQHTCGIVLHWERQGQMFCWGDNAYGQLGTRGQGTYQQAVSPVRSFGVIQYIAVAAGVKHTCAVSKGGAVYCWGENGRGQLGNGSRTSSLVPFPIRLHRRSFSSVAVGTTHSCALTTEGEVYCWGDNEAGQLGNGKGGAALAPIPLVDSLRFTAISAGGDATCGVGGDGKVSCWGSNATGQFGTGSTMGSRIPVGAVPGLTLTAISMGRVHACGLQADGAVYCWGQLSRDVARSVEPVRVGGQP